MGKSSGQRESSATRAFLVRWRGLQPAAALLTVGQEQLQIDSTLRHGRSTFAGRTVLIVGHSNTVPRALGSLGVANAPAIGQNDFHHLFFVVQHGSNAGKLMHGRYGQSQERV